VRTSCRTGRTSHASADRAGESVAGAGTAITRLPAVRILIFHGYLLGGTGSNVYNARLAAALVSLGHEVHLLCQDRHPERQSFVDAAGDWDEGSLRVRPSRADTPARAGDTPGGIGSEGNLHEGDHDYARCTVYRPDIGGLLPVYVADRYEGMQARTFADCSDAEVASYIDANVTAVREVAARVCPDVALANHLVMGPVILARALGEIPYAVKVHGSALEYTVKPHPERFLDPAREGLASARAVLVGSHHTAASLWSALGDPSVPERTRLGPPGVDVERFVPRDPEWAAAGLRKLIGRLRSNTPTSTEQETSASAFARDDRAAVAALEGLEPARDRLVAFVGKLIVNKGVDLLLAAWPLVLARIPQAKLVVVGFGADRELLEGLLDALAAGDLGRAEDIALPHLLAFLRDLSGDARDRYLAAARALPERVVLTGRLDHDELTELLPACDALVVPSTFPEAFGMVAAEAAACGALPISAAHSGLAEVGDALARAVPDQVAPWLSFPIDDSAVRALAERILAWLTAAPALREQTRAGLVATVRERWSWEGVARGVIAAARGELDALATP
jgi:glycosyltransferase involved in cell wall biosynthesis